MLLQISTLKPDGKGEIQVVHDVKLLGCTKNSNILCYTLEDGSIHEVDTRYHSVFCFADRFDWIKWKENVSH